MKKILIAVLFLLIAFTAYTYLYIPSSIQVKTSVIIHANEHAALRCLTMQDIKKRWWPGESKQLNDSSLAYSGLEFTTHKIMMNSISIVIQSGGRNYSSILQIIPFHPDSCILQWHTTPIKTNYNPFKRYKEYRDALNIRKAIDTIVHRFSSFMPVTKNVYGLDIERTTLKDTICLSITDTSSSYPSVEFVYAMITNIKTYISKNNLKPANLPMLHISKNDDSSYLVMTAIPVNKDDAGNNEIKPKRLIQYKDKILYAEVTGDEHAIEEAYKAIELYMSDNNLAAPVIPFEYILNDRTVTKPAQWKTLIYYPII